MDNLEKRFYNPILFALVLGIIFTVLFNTYMRHELNSKSGFTELYFENHQNLPKIIHVNETYNISFTFTNQEADDQEYMLEIEFPEKTLKQTISLRKEDSMTIQMGFKMVNQSWLFTRNTNITKKQTKKIIDGSLEIITLDIKEIGDILNHNITMEELRQNPIEYETNQEYETIKYDSIKPIKNNIQILDLDLKDNSVSEDTITIGETKYTLKNTAQTKNERCVEESAIEKQTIKTTNKIYIEDEKITTEIKTAIQEKTTTQKPVTIKLSKKNGGEQLEIYWWGENSIKNR